MTAQNIGRDSHFPTSFQFLQDSCLGSAPSFKFLGASAMDSKFGFGQIADKNSAEVPVTAQYQTFRKTFGMQLEAWNPCARRMPTCAVECFEQRSSYQELDVPQSTFPRLALPVAKHRPQCTSMQMASPMAPLVSTTPTTTDFAFQESTAHIILKDVVFQSTKS